MGVGGGAAALSAGPASPRFDHLGITVDDLDAAGDFFSEIGFDEEGRTLLEGPFVETVIGMPGARAEILMLRLAGSGMGIELSRFIAPENVPGDPQALSNVVGLLNLTFEVADIQGIVERLAGLGYPLIGGIGQYEEMWRMAQVRGPGGVIVGLAQRID